ncbi:tyrosine kinase receptor Cad96Ca-like [Ptychodera flava]|uniref:tyrosine kinase receptor Cad96Ca-like n=1 Tax=Ptychodera flava TaxID=63121 RepID=UPI003969F41F
MAILCIAILTRPLLRLEWVKIGEGDSRIQQTVSNEKAGDKHIITREVYLEETYLNDTGFYTCHGYYSDIHEANSNRSVLLIVENKTATGPPPSISSSLVTSFSTRVPMTSAVGEFSMETLTKGLLGTSISEMQKFKAMHQVPTTQDIDASYQKQKEGIIMATMVTVLVVVIVALFAVIVYVLSKKACHSDNSSTNGTEQDEESSTGGSSENTQGGETTENQPFIDGAQNPSVSNSGTLQPNNAIEQSTGAYATQEELIQNKPTFPSEPLEFDYCLLRFYDNCFLGRGEFGFVRKAVAPYIRGEYGDIQVAVKCLKEDALSEDKDNFLRELEIMKLLRSSHPNIVKLLGYCTSSDPICIIVELATHGSLHGYLLKNRCHGSYQNIHPQSRDLTSSDLLQFAWQIAKGMSFIDSKLFIHRDLAARNILLCDKMCCKISDFGFAHDVSATGVYKFTAQGRLPIRWMAIESLINSISTIKSDVWSYGVVLWELVTLGSTPYAQFGPRWVIQKLRTGYRLPKPRHCSDELYQIMSQCWLQDADRRPSFSELSKTIGEIANDVNEEYLRMKDFDDHIYVNIAEEEWPSDESL